MPPCITESGWSDNASRQPEGDYFLPSALFFGLV
jgi:hypothetical protein